MDDFGEKTLEDQISGLIGKYYLLEDDEDGMPQPILKIEEHDYLVLKSLSKEIYSFRYFQRKILEIQLNYRDYFSLEKSYEQELFNKEEKDERNSIIDTAYVDINRVFINFVSSLKSFLEHFEMRLKRKYGKKAEIVQKFQKFNSSNYDKMFAHRLFVNLRNYSHHEDYPINHFNFDVEYQGNKPIKGKLDINFSKEKLLNSELKKKLKYDLMMMNNEFPVKPYMLEIQKFLKKLLDKIIEIEFHQLEQAAKITMMYSSRTFNKQNVAIGYVELKGKGFIWNQTRLEVETCKYLLRKVKEMKLR